MNAVNGPLQHFIGDDEILHSQFLSLLLPSNSAFKFLVSTSVKVLRILYYYTN